LGLKQGVQMKELNSLFTYFHLFAILKSFILFQQQQHKQAAITT
jgi:hypothetical protein